jgi:DNA-binding transcriptional MerR regulator
MAVRIGEVARKTGLSIHTLRFYERQGLLPPPARSPSNYREFSPAALGRLKFICEAQQLGFTLSEIRQIVNLHGSPGASCDTLRTRAQQKLREIDDQMRHLQTIKTTLQKLIGECEATRPVTPCPIVRAINDLER